MSFTWNFPGHVSASGKGQLLKGNYFTLRSGGSNAALTIFGAKFRVASTVATYGAWSLSHAATSSPEYTDW
jgi:hypothetical protein